MSVNTNTIFKLERIALLALGLVTLALALLYPHLQREQRFPYVGIWSGIQTSTPMQITVGFDDKGSCGVRYTGTLGYTDYQCFYRMQNGAAILTTHLPGRDVGGTVRVSAQNGGRTLTYQSIGSQRVTTLHEVNSYGGS